MEDVRVRGIGQSLSVPPEAPQNELKAAKKAGLDASRNNQDDFTTVYFSDIGRVSTPVFFLDNLKTGRCIAGPAMIIDATQTIVVEPHATATILSRHVILEVPTMAKLTQAAAAAAANATLAVDPVKLSVFGFRFVWHFEHLVMLFGLANSNAPVTFQVHVGC